MRVHPLLLRIPEGCIELDGAHGEGGGQIVRTACALSALTGISCRITEIRRGRESPGLSHQHITALRGLARICAAKTTSLDLGVTEIEFVPGTLKGGRISLDTGTAGSIGLILQCLLIAGLGLPEPLSLDIQGGTDVPGAPSCTYLKHVKFILLEKMGYPIDMTIARYGYIPRGGGVVHVRITPPESLHALNLTEKPEVIHSRGISHASEQLAGRRVAERQKQAAQKTLTAYLHTPSRIDPIYTSTRSVGSSLVVWADTGGTVLGASCLGRRDVTAEDVAEKATDALMRSYHSGASMDPWMGDQILPYLALTGKPSDISVPYVTKHILTNIWVIERFLNVRFSIEEEEAHVRIACRPLPV